MRKLILQISALMVFTFCLGCNFEADADWQGSYFYEHEVGEGAGGVVGFIEYTLTITKDDKCQLEIVGLQTEEKIVCTATSAEKEISIAFQSYADGEVKNSLGIAVYAVGSTLFSLSREKRFLITHWQALLPDGIKNTSGDYFISAGE